MNFMDHVHQKTYINPDESDESVDLCVIVNLPSHTVGVLLSGDGILHSAGLLMKGSCHSLQVVTFILQSHAEPGRKPS